MGDLYNESVKFSGNVTGDLLSVSSDNRAYWGTGGSSTLVGASTLLPGYTATTAGTTTYIKLPEYTVPGVTITVKNTNATYKTYVCAVSDDTIDGGAANTQYALGPLATQTFLACGSGNWVTLDRSWTYYARNTATALWTQANYSDGNYVTLDLKTKFLSPDFHASYGFVVNFYITTTGAIASEQIVKIRSDSSHQWNSVAATFPRGGSQHYAYWNLQCPCSSTGTIDIWWTSGTGGSSSIYCPGYWVPQ